MQDILMELSTLLRNINEKKDLIVKTQKEVEIKIADLDKLLDKIAAVKIEKPEKPVMQLNKNQKS